MTWAFQRKVVSSVGCRIGNQRYSKYEKEWMPENSVWNGGARTWEWLLGAESGFHPAASKRTGTSVFTTTRNWILLAIWMNSEEDSSMEPLDKSVAYSWHFDFSIVRP